jgi:hypothetical protein
VDLPNQINRVAKNQLYSISSTISHLHATQIFDRYISCQLMLESRATPEIAKTVRRQAGIST